MAAAKKGAKKGGAAKKAAKAVKKAGGAKKGAAPRSTRGEKSKTMAAVRSRMAQRKSVRVKNQKAAAAAGSRRGFPAVGRLSQRTAGQMIQAGGRSATMFGPGFTPESGRTAAAMIRTAIKGSGGSTSTLRTLANRLERGKPLTMKQARLADRLSRGGGGGS